MNSFELKITEVETDQDWAEIPSLIVVDYNEHLKVAVEEIEQQPAYFNPGYFKSGEKVKYGEFTAIVVKKYSEGMWGIRVPGGLTCVCGSELEKDAI